MKRFFAFHVRIIPLKQFLLDVHVAIKSKSLPALIVRIFIYIQTSGRLKSL